VQTSSDGAEKIRVRECVLIAVGGGGEPGRCRVLGETEEMSMKGWIDLVKKTGVKGGEVMRKEAALKLVTEIASRAGIRAREGGDEVLCVGERRLSGR
jgi:hypothetical protein